jgi:hypothetical protein
MALPRMALTRRRFVMPAGRKVPATGAARHGTTDCENAGDVGLEGMVALHLERAFESRVRFLLWTRLASAPGTGHAYTAGRKAGPQDCGFAVDAACVRLARSA